MSSLSQQLKSINEKTASVAFDRRSRAKIHSKSIVFEPKVAAAQDYDYIYQIGIEGLEELIDIDRRFAKFRETLFAESTINFDRNVQSKETLSFLDKNIGAFLALVGPYYLLAPAYKAVEWLIRRFYINIHNSETLLLASLPYFKSSIFVRLLNVIPKNNFPKLFESFIPFKEAMKNPSSYSVFRILRDNGSLFSLYTLHLIDDLHNNCCYHEQLVFYLQNTLQVITSFGNEPERFGSDYLPSILKIIGELLLANSKKPPSLAMLATDIRLTAYSLLTVVNTVTPLSYTLVESFTKTILLDSKSMESKIFPKTLIVLNLLWNSVQQIEPEDCLREIKPSLLTGNDLLGTLLKEGHDMDRFLEIYALSNIDASGLPILFDSITNRHSEEIKVQFCIKLLESTNDIKSDTMRNNLVAGFELFLKKDRQIFYKALSMYDSRMGLSDLEMLLSTTLDNHDNPGKDGQEELHEVETEFYDANEGASLNVEEIVDQMKSHKTEVRSFFHSSTTEEFLKLLSFLTSKFRLLSQRDQKILLSKFSQNMFPNVESSISFMLRAGMTPAVPFVLRLAALRFTVIRLKELSNLKERLEMYVLVPICLLGLYDSHKLIRASFVELLYLIKKVSEKLNANQKNMNAVLFMEDQIYDNTESGSRAIISPNDAYYMLTILCDHSKSFIDDVVFEQYKLNYMIFQSLFKCTKKDQKKFGSLLLKTFILNQWTLPFWPIVLKSKVWMCVSNENRLSEGIEERHFFEPDLSQFINNRNVYLEDAKIAKIDFVQEVEEPLANLICGKCDSVDICLKEVDLLLKGINQSNEFLDIAARRIQAVFPHITAGEARFKLVSYLVDLLVDEDDNRWASNVDLMDLLQSLYLDSQTVNSLLKDIQIVTEVPEQGIVKRRRRSSNSAKQAMAREDISNMASNHLKKFTVVLDVLEHLLGDANSRLNQRLLLQSYFKILTDLDYLGHDGNMPILYAQEVLATCMHISILRLKAESPHEAVRLDSNSVRADLIVNSIRNSQSPQVQNRFLLVIAELASIAPEIILHSIMPIFTFMGAHTIRQDDEFSSSALQQTIAKVVPALAQSGTSVSNEVEFLLTSFVAALQHIPKHRRVNLFTSITNTLGPQNSLHIILFLVGQQFANLSKPKPFEVNSLIDFVVSYMSTFTALEQVEGLTQYFELWEKVPVRQLKPNTDAYNALLSRPIFGVGIVSMPTEELLLLKGKLISFLVKLITFDSSRDFVDSISLKMKIAVFLLDKNENVESHESALSFFRRLSTSVLASLEEFKEEDLITPELYLLLENLTSLLPMQYFMRSIIDSVRSNRIGNNVGINVASRFVLLCGKKVETEVSSQTIDDNLENIVFVELLPVFIEGIRGNKAIELQQAYLNAISVLVNKFFIARNNILNHSQILLECLNVITTENGLLNAKPEIVIPSINAIASIVNALGVKTIGYFHKVVPPALRIWEEKSRIEQNSPYLQTAVLLLLSCYVKRLPAFMITSLDSVFYAVFTSERVDSSIKHSILNVIVETMEPAEVLKSLYDCWDKRQLKLYDHATAFGLYLNVMQTGIDRMEKKIASSQATMFMKWLIQAFEFNQMVMEKSIFDTNTVHRIESAFYTCAISYVLKLNDKSFRPLFANLVRWATTGEGTTSSHTVETARLLAFFRFLNKLQEELKGIITSYYTYLVDPVASILSRFETDELKDVNLRRVILQSLTSSFKHDQEDYWSHEQRFDKIAGPLLRQLVNIETTIGKYLVKAITALAADVSEELNKKLVNIMTPFISTENKCYSSNTKIWTIRSFKTIFQKLGEQWLPYLSTLVPYIAELLDDDDENVEIEVRSGLVRVIENVLGEPLDRYFD